MTTVGDEEPTETRNLSFFCLYRAVHMVIASAAAVASSSSEELDIGMPVKSHTIVWKFSRDSNLQRRGFLVTPREGTVGV